MSTVPAVPVLAMLPLEPGQTPPLALGLGGMVLRGHVRGHVVYSVEVPAHRPMMEYLSFDWSAAPSVAVEPPITMPSAARSVLTARWFSRAVSGPIRSPAERRRFARWGLKRNRWGARRVPKQTVLTEKVGAVYAPLGTQDALIDEAFALARQPGAETPRGWAVARLKAAFAALEADLEADPGVEIERHRDPGYALWMAARRALDTPLGYVGAEPVHQARVEEARDATWRLLDAVDSRACAMVEARARR